MDAFTTNLIRSPELFPLTLNPGGQTIRVIRLTEPDYARISFLDGRILGPSTTLVRPVLWEDILSAVAEGGLPERYAFIFHIGHVGSTLISRLIGTHWRILPLREPALLRDLAFQKIAPETQPVQWGPSEWDRRLTALLQLWSRTFRPGQLPVIKATSFVSELASELLSRPSHPQAIFMHVPAETYLASILGAENSPQEARILAEMRLKRLHGRLGPERWLLSDMSLGEIVAMSWACEMLALSAAADAAQQRGMWLNFESFLENPAAHLCQAFRHLGVAVSVAETERILFGPEMRRYSKAPEHPYDANLRRGILSQAHRKYGDEIARGLKWLEDAGLLALGPVSPQD